MKRASKALTVKKIINSKHNMLPLKKSAFKHIKGFLIIIVFLFSIVSCKNEINDYVSISGHFDSLETNDTLIKINSRKYSKVIKIDSKGNFKDTLHIKEGDYYSIALNKKTRFSPFLNIGDNLTITGDASDLNNTLHFKGRGEITNNYLITRAKEVALFTADLSSLYALDSIYFNANIDGFSKKMTALLAVKKMDSTVIIREENGLKGFVMGLKTRYKREHALLVAFKEGTVSPKFRDFENFNGGTTSLDDLLGKYVYIDVWATWCRPCLREIPALKELEETYRDKNIEFVSISTDKPDKHEAWKNMIRAKDMSGIQLYAGKDNSFSKEYLISSIPRFIFIDPEGNIVSANAPRPSNAVEIKKMFDKVGL